MYLREAERAEKAKANLAACVMMGSTIETMLMMMVDTHLDEAFASGKWPTRKTIQSRFST
jgi:hypothetical protein